MALEFSSYLQKVLPGVPLKSAVAVLELVKEGATVPFIARYRKEKTGDMDEVQVRDIAEAHETFQEVMKRQAFMLKEIEAQGNLTDELKTLIAKTWDLGELEEIYKPYKKKKKTKATVAREAGLEPLANWIWDLAQSGGVPEVTFEVRAKDYLQAAAGFATYELVLKGVQEILVEKLVNQPHLRQAVLDALMEKGKIVSVKAKAYKAHSKYEMYQEFEEPVKRLFEARSSHRYLAMRRGWQEGELALTIVPLDEKQLIQQFFQFACKSQNNQVIDFMDKTANAAYSAHVSPSVVNEVHRRLKEQADEHAIEVFAQNVKRLLLSSPYGNKCVLGVDPGLRTGAKVALVDQGGNYISHTVVQTLGDGAQAQLEKLLKELLEKIQVQAIAVGNGTGGRETEKMFRQALVKIEAKVPVVLVNESGASVYSASDVAREEFPDLDLTVRGAISIARRLQDPLAELVKIDPKSIGVGQYQHDVSPTKLKKSLDFVVESCVNHVGVELNTASSYLLSYVAGIGPAVAKKIVEFRKEHGAFADRETLLKVSSFSSKTFEQSAGFLRVAQSKNILDHTGIHPERYSAVREMAQSIGCPISQLVTAEGIAKLKEAREKWVPLVGEYTFNDIVSELEKPGRDPRDPFKVFSFRDDISEVKDLKEAMICPGVVTNVTNFGVFVDIGVHQDGLVHISELSNQFVSDPRSVVNVGDQIQVKVLKVDSEKNQISLTMKMTASAGERAAPREAAAPKERRPRSDQPRQAARGPAKGARPAKAENAEPKFKPRPEGSRPMDRKAPPPTQGGRPGSGPNQGHQKPGGKPFNNSFGDLMALKDQLKR